MVGRGLINPRPKKTTGRRNIDRGEAMIDLTDPTLDKRLQQRTAEGRFEISEIEVV